MAPVKARSYGRMLAALLAVGIAATLARAQELDGGAAAPSEPAAPPMAVPTPRPDGRCHVTLTDGSQLVARLDMDDKLTLDSVVGRVTVPLAKIDAIDDSRRPELTIYFRNGDQLSGKVALKTLKFQTLWGEAEIELRHIVSIISHERYLRQQAANSAPASGYGAPATYYNGGYGGAPGSYGAEAIPLEAPSAPSER